MNPLGVGIIGARPGAGWAAATHVPALQPLPQYDLRAVATGRAESAQRATAEWQAQAFLYSRQLIAHPDVDLVVVAVKVPDLRGPARNVAALYAAFAHDLDQGTSLAPSFSDAVRLHRLVERIAGGATTAGVKMTSDSEETPCAQQS